MKKKKDRALRFFCIAVTVILAAAIILRFFLHSIIVVGASMYPTYNEGDILTRNVNFVEEDINYNEVITIDEGDKWIIKRVYGLPRDTVLIKDKKLYINGKIVDTDEIDYAGVAQEELTLDENQYFVMGDNIKVSSDSRSIGPISFDQITGIVTGRVIKNIFYKGK